MAARQLGADSDKMEGRNVQIYLLFSLEAEDLKLEAQDFKLEVENFELEAEDVYEVYHVAEARLETLSCWRKQVSTC